MVVHVVVLVVVVVVVGLVVFVDRQGRGEPTNEIGAISTAPCIPPLEEWISRARPHTSRMSRT